MSANKVYVGNLPFNFTKVDLTELFQGFGPVRSAEIITDRETGRSRGFGFVDMETSEAMQQAIAGLHERNVQGRNLTVNEARERSAGFSPRPPGGGGGGSFRPSGPPRTFSGGGGSGGGGSGGGGPRPAWSDSKPRFDKGGGSKDRRGERGRGDERGGAGRGKRGKGWGDDDQ